MSTEFKIMIIGLFIIFLTVIVIAVRFIIRRAKLRPRKKKFDARWKDLQKLLKDKSCWSDALIQADKLLDKALIKRGYKGQSMGERLVNAQRAFSDNDSVWFGHKLVKKIHDNPELPLKEVDVKNALLGLKKGLKDLGAL
ncbi:MAG TPA: hypothetical protein PKB09_01370 [Candidatus Saccharibacteria bacterium]|nr:hypothetical protein [Candidatus Saccharibacteria bacterium]